MPETNGLPVPPRRVVPHAKATRLAIEPHNGLAPPKWQGGPHNHLGTVAVARTDLRDFTVEDWRVSEVPGAMGMHAACPAAACTMVHVRAVLHLRVGPGLLHATTSYTQALFFLVVPYDS